jgi:hypothetical protein
MISMRWRMAAPVGLALVLCGCGSQDASKRSAADVAALHRAGMVLADDIPIAHTPPGGYGKTFPRPVLARCTEPLVKGAPDLRGIWKVLRAERNGVPVPKGERIWKYVERIEQCGNRVIDMGGGTICDARADGTEKNADHDVSVFDYKTPITAVASYEDGTFVLRPLLIPYVPVTLPFIEVTRRLDADGHMIWIRPDLGHLRVTLLRIGKSTDPYTRK